MNETLGIPFVPMTFPTVAVASRVKQGGGSMSWNEVDRAWACYKLGVMNGEIHPYEPTAPPEITSATLRYMVDCGMSKMNAAAWLNAAYDAAKVWGWRWIDPKLMDRTVKAAAKSVSDAVTGAAKTVGDAAGVATGPITGNVTGIVRWGAIAAVAGAVVYGGYLYSKSRRVRRVGRK